MQISNKQKPDNKPERKKPGDNQDDDDSLRHQEASSFEASSRFTLPLAGPDSDEEDEELTPHLPTSSRDTGRSRRTRRYPDEEDAGDSQRTRPYNDDDPDHNAVFDPLRILGTFHFGNLFAPGFQECKGFAGMLDCGFEGGRTFLCNRVPPRMKGLFLRKGNVSGGTRPPPR